MSENADTPKSIYITASEAIDMLPFGKTKFHQLVSEGVIKGHVFAGMTYARYLRAEIEAYTTQEQTNE